MKAITAITVATLITESVSVAKAMAIILLYACVVVVGMIALQATEFGRHRNRD